MLKDIQEREKMSKELSLLNDSINEKVTDISEVAKKIATGDYAVRLPTSEDKSVDAKNNSSKV